MCGILGQVTKQYDAARFAAGFAALAHRGPDAAGIFVHQGAGAVTVLGHRRLSIIDLAEVSNQPFAFGRFQLSYNGEIYNYLELRARLEQLGCVFKTSGDTEVLAQALAHWGLDALDRLEGMWAFAWLDTDSGETILCRDRFGEKPLHYAQTDDGIYFGSELKALAGIAGLPLSPNWDQVNRYFVNGYKSLFKTRETFIAGIHSLDAGHFLRIRDGRIVESGRYWQLEYRPDNSRSYQDCVELCREKVLRSVDLRLRSDAPLAFCLSGGIDSNSLVNAALALGRDEVETYTIVSSDSRYEESEFVALTASRPGVRNHALPVSHAAFLDNLRAIVTHRAAPVSTLSYYLHWQLLGALSRDGNRVSISGTAADELFTGYYDHHNLYLHAVRNDQTLFNESLRNWQDKIAPIVRNPVLQNPLCYLQNPGERSHVYFRAGEYTGFLRQNWREDFTEENYCAELLRMRMLNELFAEAVPAILNEDDLNAMYFSVENRSPFLDRDLAEFAFTIPSAYLVRNGRTKAVLRDAMRGIVPDAILDNARKVGFNANLSDLFSLADSGNVAFVLDDGPIYEYIDRAKMEAFVASYGDTNSDSKFLFNFLNLRLFLEELN